MRQIISSFVTLATLAALAGCASSPPSSVRARSSGDVVTAMNNELAHTVDQGGGPVGTTTITSANVEQEPAVLPADRMSLKNLQVEPLPEPSSPSIPSSGN